MRGNVIGGGDWAAHRVLPDAVRALEAGKPLVLRRPGAVRPWQHVLDPLAGYLEAIRRGCGRAFNFGPEAQDRRTVAELVDAFGAHFAGRPGRTLENAEIPPEAPYLTLSAARAAAELGWEAEARLRRRGLVDRRMGQGMARRRRHGGVHAPPDRGVRTALARAAYWKTRLPTDLTNRTAGLSVRAGGVSDRFSESNPDTLKCDALFTFWNRIELL